MASYIDPKKISSSIPKEKPQGDNALIKLAKDQALLLLPPILTTVEALALQFGTDKLSELSQNLDLCPTQAFIDKNTVVINNLIEEINKISKTLKTINDYSTNITNILNVSDQILSVLNNFIALGTIAELSFIPPAIPPGTLVGGVDGAKTVRDNVFFNSQGLPRIPQFKGVIQSMSFYIGIASGFIALIQGVLGDIINVLQICSKTPVDLVDFNSDFNALAEQGNLINSGVNSEQTNQQDTDTYKGFRILIQTEQDPDNFLIKRKAVGVNKNGIIQVETPFSFTTNSKSLIDELKLIIDRNNLKAE